MPAYALRDCFAEIMSATGRAVDYIHAYDKKQTGGVLCVADLSTGIPILIRTFGKLTEAEFKEYLAFAMEKAGRLAKHPDHFSSAQTRDMDADPQQYAGAIRGKSFIYSFSGFTEEQDEAAMLATAKQVGDMDSDSATLIAQFSGNVFFRKLEVAFSYT